MRAGRRRRPRKVDIAHLTGGLSNVDWLLLAGHNTAGGQLLAAVAVENGSALARLLCGRLLLRLNLERPAGRPDRRRIARRPGSLHDVSDAPTHKQHERSRADQQLTPEAAPGLAGRQIVIKSIGTPLRRPGGAGRLFKTARRGGRARRRRRRTTRGARIKSAPPRSGSPRFRSHFPRRRRHWTGGGGGRMRLRHERRRRADGARPTRSGLKSGLLKMALKLLQIDWLSNPGGFTHGHEPRTRPSAHGGSGGRWPRRRNIPTSRGDLTHFFRSADAKNAEPGRENVGQRNNQRGPR